MGTGDRALRSRLRGEGATRRDHARPARPHRSGPCGYPFGIALATIDPGLYATGFNDTGAESSGQWSGQGEVHIPMPDAAPLLKLQRDPQPMIDAIVEMIPERKGAFRTMLPEDAVLEAKASQALGWTQKSR